jgi:hypothetical protein
MNLLESEGAYTDIPEEIYRAAAGISQSELKEFGDAASPLHFKTRKPKEATEDMEFGTVCHTAILEPANLPYAYHLQPKEYEGEEKGKKVMKPWSNAANVCKEWNKTHANRPVLDAEQIMRVNKIADRIRYIPEFKAALDIGQKEVAFLKRDPVTGLMLKCRCDLVANDTSGITWIFDLKKVQRGCATHEEFSKSSGNYGYFIQASFYQFVTGASRFIFVPFDDSDPFDACLFEPDAESLEIGYQQWRKLLTSYAQCVKEDLWPGYPSGIQPLSVPKWMKYLSP